VPDESPPTILVVEDDEPLRRIMVRALSRQGFPTLEARSGAEGLAYFLSNKRTIGLVIIEMVMPCMSGLDLAAELDRLRPGMAILYMSSLPESIAMESIARRSPERVLAKPFTPDDLRQRVRHLLGQTQPIWSTSPGLR
jgi:DNA-binding response OmpR family regulator